MRTRERRACLEDTLAMDKMHVEIAEIVKEINPTVEIPSDKFGESMFEMGLDSLDHASILLAIEEKYGIKIPDEETPNLISLDALAGYVAKATG